MWYLEVEFLCVMQGRVTKVKGQLRAEEFPNNLCSNLHDYKIYKLPVVYRCQRGPLCRVNKTNSKTTKQELKGQVDRTTKVTH